MCEAFVQFLGPRWGGEIPYVVNRKSYVLEITEFLLPPTSQ